MGLVTEQNSGLLWDGDILGPHGFLWGFVALEYYALISNRVWMLLITRENLVAINAGGLVMAPLIASEQWYEPAFYLNRRRVRRYEFLAADSDDVLRVSKANWRGRLAEIRSVTFKQVSKEGMGTVPYSGRLFVSVGERRHDLILLGLQDGKEIEEACLIFGSSTTEMINAHRTNGRRFQPSIFRPYAGGSAARTRDATAWR